MSGDFKVKDVNGTTYRSFVSYDEAEYYMKYTYPASHWNLHIEYKPYRPKRRYYPKRSYDWHNVSVPPVPKGMTFKEYDEYIGKEKLDELRRSAMGYDRIAMYYELKAKGREMNYGPSLETLHDYGYGPEDFC